MTPFAKVPPEVKRVEKPLGVIGQKVNSANSGNNNSNNLGTLHRVSSPVTSVTVSSMSNSLFTMPDSNYPPRLKDDSYSRNLYGSYVETGPLTVNQTGNSIHSWDPKTLSAPLRPPPGLAQSHDTPHRHSSISGQSFKASPDIQQKFLACLYTQLHHLRFQKEYQKPAVAHLWAIWLT